MSTLHSVFRVLACVAILQTVAEGSDDSICNSTVNILSDTTVLNYCLYSAYHQALINHTPNYYTMRKAFFYARTDDPVIYRVVYNITYDSNFGFQGVAQCPDDQTPYLNSTNQTTYMYGWSSTGVYTIIHPLLLNAMQFQLILFMQKLYNLFSEPKGPLVESLLWDGRQKLPDIELKLHITTVPCVPSKGQINDNLEELTRLLKTYAGKYFEGTEINSKEYLGFTVECESISASKNMLLYKQSLAIYICYMVYIVFTFSIIMWVLWEVFNKEGEEIVKNIDNYIDTHRLFYQPVIAVSAATLLLLILSDIIAIVWWSVSLHQNKNSGANIAAVVSLQLLFLTKKGFIIGITANKQRKSKRWSYQHAAIINVSAIISLGLDHAPPTFLYLLVYPIDTAATLMFTVAMYSLASVAIAAVMKLTYNKISTTKMFIIGSLIFILSLFLYFVGQWLIYLLAIGKTAVVSIGRLTIFSFLPSVGIGIITWIIKEKVFNGTNNMQGKNNNAQGGDNNQQDDIQGQQKVQGAPDLTQQSQNIPPNQEQQSDSGLHPIPQVHTTPSGTEGQPQQSGYGTFPKPAQQGPAQTTIRNGEQLNWDT